MKKIFLIIFFLTLFINGCTKNIIEEGYPKDSSLEKYKGYINKPCTESSDCDSLPCIEGKCIVHLCKTDGECPNKLCGLHLTPNPGFCTTIDVI